jgi:hypothetical protein
VDPSKAHQTGTAPTARGQAGSGNTGGMLTHNSSKPPGSGAAGGRP